MSKYVEFNKFDDILTSIDWKFFKNSSLKGLYLKKVNSEICKLRHKRIKKTYKIEEICETDWIVWTGCNIPVDESIYITIVRRNGKQETCKAGSPTICWKRNIFHIVDSDIIAFKIPRISRNEYISKDLPKSENNILID